MPGAPFIHDDFLLGNKTARRLYHEHAAAQPILGYHNHLPPARRQAASGLTHRVLAYLIMLYIRHAPFPPLNASTPEPSQGTENSHA